MATKTVLSFEGERELVTETRAHELVRTYADAEAQLHPPAFTHITLRNKSYTLEAARVIAAFFSRLAARDAFAQLTSVDFADMIAGRPEDEALQVLATLCDALSAFKTLTRIDLSDNALGEKGVRACFGLLQRQEQLRHVYFCNNGISAAAADVIAQEVLLFRGADVPAKLETFHFYNNMSGDGGAIALAKLLPLSPALKDLRFSATRAQREGSLAFATALASLKKLEKLDLSDNTFKTQGGEAIAAAVKSMPNLVELNLRDAAIEDDGMVAIADALREGGAAPALTALDVSGNDLTEESMSALGQLLRVGGALRVLQVEENEIGSKGAKAIAKALNVGTPALEKVVANINEIGASGALALVKAVVDKKAFAQLAIDGNQISAHGVAEIEALLESKSKSDVLGSLEDNDEDEEEEDEEEEQETTSVDDVTILLSKKLTIASDASFEFEDKSREVVDAARAQQLLEAAGINASERSPLHYKSISLRGKSYTDSGAKVIADSFLSRLQSNLKVVDLADVIAGRPEDEALRVLSSMSSALRGHVLEEIDLSDNALGEKGVRACFALLIPQPTLRRLLFCNNGISAAAASVIAQEIVLQNGKETQSTLTEFHFYNNMSGHDGCVAVANVLAHCKELTVLRYASARAGPEASEQMARSVNAHLSGLTSLDLSDCSFEDDGAAQLAEAISKQPKLQFLKLRDASLCAEGAEKVVKALASSNIQLLELDLSGNELMDEGITALAPLLKAQAQLKVLRLDENEVTSDGLKQFVAALSGSSLPALEELSLCGNEITAKGAIAVVDTFVPSKAALARLELDTNMISDKGVEHIKASLARQGKASILGSLEENDGDEESDDE
jgi:Ran GTPase-activating protein (RanGAP) involved in mRNA processing and transport